MSDNIVHGDLLALARDGRFDFIVHGCNCFCTMGAGIARQIRSQVPAAWEADQRTVKGDRAKLGTFTSGKAPGHSFYVLNAYIQYRYGRDRVHVDYDAIRDAFSLLAHKIRKSGKTGVRIGYPAIGCGLAGGDLDTVRGIIDQALEGLDHTLVLFQG